MRRWITRDLTPEQRHAVRAVLKTSLAELGLGVCQTAYGKHLGKGLAELRIRLVKAQSRIFFHVYGDRVVLLLGAYDKGRDPSAKRQQNEIETARRRLAEFRRRPPDIDDWRSR